MSTLPPMDPFTGEARPSPLARLNRRLSVLTGLFGLLAYAGTGSASVLPAALAGAALLLALAWQPGPVLSARLERLWVPVALLLVGRALYQVIYVQGDVVLPVVDLLLLLLATEALRSLDAENDARLHTLAFALLLSATAYQPGALFGVAFVGYVVIATVALAVGHLRREAARHGEREPKLAGCPLWRLGALAVPILAASVVIFTIFPRVTEVRGSRMGTPAIPVAGFSQSVALGTHGARILDNPRVMLRVEFPEGRPPGVEGLYFRGRSYDRFDGLRWLRSRSLPSAAAPLGWYEERWGGAEIVQRIVAAPMEGRVIFGAHPVIEVLPESRMSPALDPSGDLLYSGRGIPEYTVRSLAGRPSTELLRGASGGGFAPARAFYLQLPGFLDPAVHALADSLAAGLPTRYDQVIGLVRWFQNSFDYTTELPATPLEASIEHFLFERRAGHCEYFSTGLAVLLRSLDIPARVVNGFLGGRWNEVGGYLQVTGNQAHAWVEVWFPGLGWVPFDATPPGEIGAAAGTGRFAGARALLDGIQHRWNRWVLDYSGSRQAALLERTAGLLRTGEESGPDPDGQGGSSRPPGVGVWPLLLLGALLLTGVAGAGVVVLRAVRRHSPGHGRHRPVSRIWIGLQRAATRAGFDQPGQTSVHGLLEAAEAVGHPASAELRRAAGLYLRLRFSGAPPTAGEIRELRDATRHAIRKLAATPSDPTLRAGPTPPVGQEAASPR